MYKEAALGAVMALGAAFFQKPCADSSMMSGKGEMLPFADGFAGK